MRIPIWERRWGSQGFSCGEMFPFLDIPFPAFVSALAWSEMALPYILVSEDHAGVIYETAEVVFSLDFLYKIVRQREHSATCLRFLLGWLGE